MIEIEYNNMEVRRMDLVELMKALSHQNRLRIINLISKKELCVCELEYIMDLNQSNVSRHLRKLKQANIISGERDAQWIHYSLNKNTFKKHPFLKLLLKEELGNMEICKKDNNQFKKYENSGLSCKDLREDV